MATKYSGILESCSIEPPYYGACTLVSFDLVVFLQFAAIVILAGPLCYRLVASGLNLERHYFSVVGLYSFLTSGLQLAFIVFVLGNYANTFNYITIASYFCGIFAYSYLVELPFLKVALPTYMTWSKSAWITHIVALALVISAAAWFIRLAALDGFALIYIVFFVFATGFLWVPFIFNKTNSYIIQKYPGGHPLTRIPRKSVFSVRNILSKASKRKTASNNANPVSNPTTARSSLGGTTTRSYASHELEKLDENRKGSTEYLNSPIIQSNNNSFPEEVPAKSRCVESVELKKTAKEGSSQELIPSFERSSSNASLQSTSSSNHSGNENMPTNGISTLDDLDSIYKPSYLGLPNENPWGRVECYVHTHHWQIFYILAFFTRFPTVFSRICSGIVLGIYTQGASAYGFDRTFNPKND